MPQTGIPITNTALRVLLPALAAAGWLAPGISAACSPDIPSLAASYDQSEDVFIARIGAEVTPRQKSLNPGTVQVVVTERFKGATPVHIVPNEIMSSICYGEDLIEGKEYLFFRTKSGSIATPGFGLAEETVADYIARLRAYRDGEAPDLSELWGFSYYGGSCRLGTALSYSYSSQWEDDSPSLHLGQISINYDVRDNSQRVRTELPRATLRVQAINPMRNSQEPVLAQVNAAAGAFDGLAVWTPDHVREYVNEDGEIDTSPPQDVYLLGGPSVINFIEQLTQSETPVRIHVNLGGQYPDIELEFPVSRLGDAATQMLACIRDNQ